MSSKRFGNVCPSSSDDDEDAKFPDKYGCPTNAEGRSRRRKASMTSNSSEEVRRRGRGHRTKGPCLNRNALMARENRQRKKEYLMKLESKLSFYQRENKNLANVIRRQGIDVKRLNGEVAYLRSVLSNNTSIAALLRTMNEGLARSAGSRDGAKNAASAVSGKNRISAAREERCLGNDMTADERRKGEEKTAQLFSDSDHTYTMTRRRRRESDGNLAEEKTDTEEEEETRAEEWSAGLEDRDGDTTGVKIYENDLPVTPTSMTHSDDKLELNVSDVEFDELSRLNVDIFDNLTSLDDISSPLDDLENASNLFSDGNLFENLGDTGICLHVNSGKVSLEFCTVCRMNSLNSEAE